VPPEGGFLRDLLDPVSFTLCWHLRPHGGGKGLSLEDLGDFAGKAVRGGRVGAFLISDDRPGEPGPPGPLLAEEVLGRGGVPVVSFSPADRTRDGIIERLREYHAAGVRDLLLVTGDYAVANRGEGEEPSFDLDSLQLLMFLREAAEAGAGFLRAFSRGCVVSPFKSLESEVMWQYAGLVRKTEAGGEFIVSQAGYDPRSWDELARFCRRGQVPGPLVGNLLLPDGATVKCIREGLVPGVTLPAALLERMEEEAGKGTGVGEAALLRGGKAAAVLRGLGYHGVLLGGGLEYDEVHALLDEAERHYPKWRECLEAIDFPEPRYYYFRRGAGPGLNEDDLEEVSPKKRRHPIYLLSYLVDYIAFGSWPPFFRVLTAICRFCDTRPFWRRVLWLTEYVSKVPVYGCRMCGDCTLYAAGFLCYEAGCPKKMVNGPCGGSVEGFCEVHPGKRRCFWVKVYDRLKGTAERPGFVAPAIPPKDHSLDGTCSWISFCLGRDHRKIGTPEKPPA
jgi:methylenetetrahydrofolate reductase (NADPH)